MPTLKPPPNPQINTPANADPTATDDEHQTPKMSDYEQSREERIKQNLERMQKLGLVDLSLKLKSLAASATPKRIPRQNSPSSSSIKHVSPMKQPGPIRRSSRLQNVTPVSYSEALLTKKDGVWEEDVRPVEGSKPEVYTEEHEKLLGNTERTWTPFVDGCGKDGRRIYDQVRGKTCHQCRQKTLGYRTHCSKCNMVKGQFCGDCLYMRYGEHVLEAIENPNWVCPVCRGICNCSLCRQAKGWPPTGTLYRKISSLGYKSVAHYLIQTRRSQNSKATDSALNQVSTRRSLPFLDMEAPINEYSQVKDEEVGALEHQSKDKIHSDLAVGALKHESEEKLHNGYKKEKKTQMPSSKNPGTGVQTKRSLPFSGGEAKSENMQSAEVNHVVQSLRHKSEDEQNYEFKVEEQKLHSVNKEQHDSKIALESCPKLHNNPAVAIKPSPESIAARLCSRRRRGDGYDDAELAGVNEKSVDAKQAVNNAFSSQELHEEKELYIKEKRHVDSIFALDSSPKLNGKPACATEPSSDSIGSRVRKRRLMDQGHNDDELLGTNEKTSKVAQALDSVSCNSQDDAGLSRFNEKSPDAKLAVNNIFSDQEPQKEKEKHVTGEKHSDSITVLDGSPELKRNAAAATPPTSVSIGSRVQRRRKMGKGHYDDLLGTNEQTSGVREAFNRISFNSHNNTELGGIFYKTSGTNQAVNNALSDQGVQKAKEMLIKDSISALDSSPKLTRGPACPSQPISESIGSRVRQRHNLVKGQNVHELPGTREQTSEFGLASNGISSPKEAEVGVKLTRNTKPCKDSIARRLRPRH